MRQVKLVNLANVINANTKLDKSLIKKAYAFTLYREVIKGTPVDTGRARANWHITDDAPNYATTESLQPEFGVQISGDGDIYIANGLPYINRLDTGYSGQAPQGILGPAIATTRNKYK